jgi:ankyrin repeat protein
LIDAGADADVKDEEGETALMWAAAGGHTEVVKILKRADL